MLISKSITGALGTIRSVEYNHYDRVIIIKIRSFNSLSSDIWWFFQCSYIVLCIKVDIKPQNRKSLSCWDRPTPIWVKCSSHTQAWMCISVSCVNRSCWSPVNHKCVKLICLNCVIHNQFWVNWNCRKSIYHSMSSSFY